MAFAEGSNVGLTATSSVLSDRLERLSRVLRNVLVMRR